MMTTMMMLVVMMVMIIYGYEFLKHFLWACFSVIMSLILLVPFSSHYAGSESY